MAKPIISLVDRVREVFAAPQTQPADPATRIRQAVAVLLVEMERADFSYEPEERQELRRLLARRFEIAVSEVDELIRLAEQTDPISLHQYISELNTLMPYGERCDMVQMLWEMAYADGQLHRYEEHLLRKIADLLHVSHSDFIRTKLAVEAARENSSD